ncbi:uncharacterized protein LOC143378524 [Andrena cerasifolii]|uniref:uncharacterized protein LOC143378524 n=1 Tax=Andrena cerasifolii TaxID=2819439 RepID=UPI0040379DFA
MFAVNNDRNLAVVVVIAAAVQLTVADRRRSRRRNRQAWLKKYCGDCNDQPLLRELRENYPDDYRNYLRMDCKAFDDLLGLVQNRIKKMDTIMRKSITAEQRLIATLRFLATGRSYEDLKFTTGISAPALCKIIPETCKTLYYALRTEFLKFSNNKDEWKKIAEGFHDKWDFANCEVLWMENTSELFHHRIPRPCITIVTSRVKVFLGE